MLNFEIRTENLKIITKVSWKEEIIYEIPLKNSIVFIFLSWKRFCFPYLFPSSGNRFSSSFSHFSLPTTRSLSCQLSGRCLFSWFSLLLLFDFLYYWFSFGKFVSRCLYFNIFSCFSSKVYCVHGHVMYAFLFLLDKVYFVFLSCAGWLSASHAECLDVIAINYFNKTVYIIWNLNSSIGMFWVTVPK